MPMVWTSKLVYAFADILSAQRKGEYVMTYPSEIPRELLEKFKDESINFRNFSGDGNGMPFTMIANILLDNIDKVEEIRKDDGDFEYVKEAILSLKAKEDEDQSSDAYFLETFRSIKSKRQCVYGVVKDTNTKRLVIAFRGSVGLGKSRDWPSNLNAFMAKMKTPKLLQNKLKGKLSKEIRVHKGFYEYLFDNKKIIDGGQRYDKILDDIKPLLEDDDGYKIWVTGHSLGAALSSTVAFKLAGSDKEWIPKPITCISFASPLTGSADLRTAFEQLEKDGLLRYLRFTNNYDLVPSSPPAFSHRQFKHVGINLRLYDDKVAVHHSSRSSMKTALQNSLVKPFWNFLYYHRLNTHAVRMRNVESDLKAMTIDGLYEDKSVVGGDFVREEL